MSNNIIAVAMTSLFLFFFFKPHQHIDEKNKWLRSSTTFIQNIKNNSEIIPQRELSSETDSADKSGTDKSCMPHSAELNRLKQEISQLENERNKLVNVSYKKEFWRHLSLESVPSIMAQALIKNNKLISEEINLENCKDLICVYNTIYNDETAVTGHLLYWFYLKTGYFVTATSDHPYLIIPSNEKLEKMIFQKSELPVFWAMGQSLPPSMTFLPTLRSIYRAPIKPSYNLIQKEDNKKFTAAALAYSDGWVFFVDNCLSKKYSWETEELEGMGGRSIECFYHEFTHHVDYSFGNLHKNVDNRPSQKDDWMKLSDWKKVEEQKGDTIYWHWENNPDKKYISSYAKTSPAEDFAESWTFARTEPESSEKKIAEKIQYFKKLMNLSYTQSGLTEQYQSYIDKYALSRANQLVSNCSLSTDSNEVSGPEYQKCVQKVKAEETEIIIKNIKDKFWEGCQYLKTKENQTSLVSYSSKKISDEMGRVLEQSPDLKETLLSSKKLREEILQSMDSDAVVMYCTNLYSKNESEIETCYTSTIKEQIALIADEVLPNSSPEIINFEVDRYLKLNPFIDAKVHTAQLVQKHISSLEFSTPKKIQELIKDCTTIENREDNGLFAPYSGKEQFIEAGLIGCLNKKIPSLATSMIANAIGTEKNQLQEYHLNFYVNKFLPSLLQDLHSQILAASSNEFAWMNQEYGLIKESLQTSLKSKYAENQDEALAKCLNDGEALPLLSNIISSKHPQGKLNFHTLKEWNITIMKNICSNLVDIGGTKVEMTTGKQNFGKNLDIKFITIQLLQDLFNKPTQEQLGLINKCTMLYTKTFFAKNNEAATDYSYCQDLAVSEIQKQKIAICSLEMKGKPACKESLRKIKSEVFNSSNPDFFKKIMTKELSPSNEETKTIITRCIQTKAYEQTSVNDAVFIRNILDLEAGKNNFQNSCVANNIWQNSAPLFTKLKMIFAAVAISQEIRKEFGNIDTKKKWESTRANMHLRAKLIMKSKNLKNRQQCIAQWSNIEKELRVYFDESWEKSWFETNSTIKSINSERERIIADYLAGKY